MYVDGYTQEHTFHAHILIGNIHILLGPLLGPLLVVLTDADLVHKFDIFVLYYYVLRVCLLNVRFPVSCVNHDNMMTTNIPFI